MCSKDHEGGGFILYRNQWADCFDGSSDDHRPSDCGRGRDGQGFVACICGYRLLPRLSSCRPWLVNARYNLGGRPTNGISGGEM